jgi:VIT1/CCC1 family predicted Fe2+/Mn2+ transporter
MNGTLKDKLTNIAAILGVISGAILGVASQGIALPEWLLAVAAAFGSLSVAIIGYFTGKTSDGKPKTE